MQKFKEKWLQLLMNQEVMRMLTKYSTSIDQHWLTAHQSMRRQWWRDMWDDLHWLYCIVNDLQPSGWDNFCNDICGQHPEEIGNKHQGPFATPRLVQVQVKVANDEAKDF
jgi:hypothetical protein